MERCNWTSAMTVHGLLVQLHAWLAAPEEISHEAAACWAEESHGEQASFAQHCASNPHAFLAAAWAAAEPLRGRLWSPIEHVRASEEQRSRLPWLMWLGKILAERCLWEEREELPSDKTYIWLHHVIPQCCR